MEVGSCRNCKHVFDQHEHTCGECNKHYGYVKWESRNEVITFPKLNNLTPTEESCTMKLLEEVGEVFALIGKGRNLSGEQHDGLYTPHSTIAELMDVAQSASTLIMLLAEKNNIEILEIMKWHEEKLRQRGYLK